MFLDETFLLKNKVAQKLYNDYAKKMPIIDYHCHLDPEEIYSNQKFENITEAWLAGDHYKWRLMRANGISEELITGSGSDYDKFCAWAETIQKCIGNPLYVWTHLELKRIFGIEDLLNKKNADKIWNEANKIIKNDNMSTRELIKRFDVKVVCTTDNPTSDLEFHKKLAHEESFFKVYPTFRPDNFINIGCVNFVDNIKELEKILDKSINNYEQLVESLHQRIIYFNDNGCRLSDHGFGHFVFCRMSKNEINSIFSKVMNSEVISNEEIQAYQSHLLTDLMKLYNRYGWTAQLHMQASRNNNSKIFNSYGPDAGVDAMTDGCIESSLVGLFDSLVVSNELPKVIVYSLNPKDYEPIVALMGCFQGGKPSKIQFGSAWWFNDTYSGMRHQMTALAEGGVFADFIGMLTDSRSFLSYPRHEYFRRILCELISEWVLQGQVPEDYELLGEVVESICYKNATKYFEV